jgi:hypothetical protein
MMSRASGLLVELTTAAAGPPVAVDFDAERESFNCKSIFARLELTGVLEFISTAVEHFYRR